MTLTGIKKHVHVLEQAGLVATQKVGRVRTCKLGPRQLAEALTSKPFGINLVLAWDQQERLRLCLEEGVRVISFFWGNPGPLVPMVHEKEGLVLQTVSSAAQARQMAAAGVDVIVAQGWEAGGHVLGDVATLPLTRAVVDAVSQPVIAAGGIADGRGLAAILALGAPGAWIGTRFLATREASIHPVYQDLLIGAHEDQTRHTTLFDRGWPSAAHRVLRNSTVRNWEAAGEPATGARPTEGRMLASDKHGQVSLYNSTTPRRQLVGDVEAMSLWAGQGVSQLNRVEGAGEVLAGLIVEARAAVRQLARQI